MRNPNDEPGPDRSRRTTLLFFALGCVALVIALILGVADYPPGLALVYLAVAVWILAIAHRWRRVRSFLILLGVCLAGFFVSVVLHNVFYALAELASDIPVVVQVLGFLEVAFFLFGVFVCPPGVVIGALGSAVMAVVHFRQKRASNETA